METDFFGSLVDAGSVRLRQGEIIWTWFIATVHVTIYCCASIRMKVDVIVALVNVMISSRVQIGSGRS
jgi:hypothetical protein